MRKINKKTLQRLLSGLPHEARLLLAYCVFKNQPFLTLSLSHPSGKLLREMGLLVCEGDLVPVEPHRHAIPNTIWRVLQRERSLLFPEEAWTNHDFQQRMRAYPLSEFQDF